MTKRLLLDQADMPLADYLSLLRPGGHFVTVGAPETDSIPKISPFVFLMGEWRRIHIITTN